MVQLPVWSVELLFHVAVVVVDVLQRSAICNMM